MNFVVFGRDTCTYCQKAKTLLEKENHAYQFLPQAQLTGFPTVPQIWKVQSRVPADSVARDGTKELVKVDGVPVTGQRYIGGFVDLSNFLAETQSKKKNKGLHGIRALKHAIVQFETMHQKKSIPLRRRFNELARNVNSQKQRHAK